MGVFSWLCLFLMIAGFVGAYREESTCRKRFLCLVLLFLSTLGLVLAVSLHL